MDGGVREESKKDKTLRRQCKMQCNAKGGGEGVVSQRERERGNRGEYRSQSWVENTNMTECRQEIC